MVISRWQFFSTFYACIILRPSIKSVVSLNRLAQLLEKEETNPDSDSEILKVLRRFSILNVNDTGPHITHALYPGTKCRSHNRNLVLHQRVIVEVITESVNEWIIEKCKRIFKAVVAWCYVEAFQTFLLTSKRNTKKSSASR